LSIDDWLPHADRGRLARGAAALAAVWAIAALASLASGSRKSLAVAIVISTIAAVYESLRRRRRWQRSPLATLALAVCGAVALIVLVQAGLALLFNLLFAAAYALEFRGVLVVLSAAVLFALAWLGRRRGEEMLG
jgi:hypothetical protein